MIPIPTKVQCVYVDVDGTLLIWPGPKPGSAQKGVTPPVNEKLIDGLYFWKLSRIAARLEPGWLVVWSRGSQAHIDWAVDLCDIRSIVDVAIRKPDMAIDDALDMRWFTKRTHWRSPYE